MTTNALNANDFVLKMAPKYNGSTYTTIGAATTNSFTVNNGSVDITNKDGNGWQELMAGGGVKSASTSVDGIFANNTSQALLLLAHFGKIAATGNVVFGVNPSDGDEFVFNGVTWTFVSSGASGDETNIAGTLGDTLDQFIIDINASATAGLVVATYTTDSVDTVTVTYDTVGSAGNAYTLADGTQGGANTTPSAATLTGGMNMDQAWNMQMIDGAGNTWEAAFNIDSVTLGGDHNSNMTFSASFSSAGLVTYTPA